MQRSILSSLLAISVVALFWSDPLWAEVAENWPSDTEKASYAEALAYCRGNVPRPISLRDDKRVLCFDGPVENPIDPLTVFGRSQGGVFVVRSAGGELGTTIQLANTLLSKRATVIINEYCLANCASYLFFATVTTFVPKDALVAWRIVKETGECAQFSETRDPGAPHFGAGKCPREFHDGRGGEYIEKLKRTFHDIRIPGFRSPPESVSIRRILKRRFDETGKYPEDLFWTLNPRFYSVSARTKIINESYPENQDEVDAIVARVGLHEHIIYDP